MEFPPEEHSSYRVMFDVIAKNRNREKITIYTQKTERKKSIIGRLSPQCLGDKLHFKAVSDFILILNLKSKRPKEIL